MESPRSSWCTKTQNVNTALHPPPSPQIALATLAVAATGHYGMDDTGQQNHGDVRRIFVTFDKQAAATGGHVCAC